MSKLNNIKYNQPQNFRSSKLSSLPLIQVLSVTLLVVIFLSSAIFCRTQAALILRLSLLWPNTKSDPMTNLDIIPDKIFSPVVSDPDTKFQAISDEELDKAYSRTCIQSNMAAVARFNALDHIAKNMSNMQLVVPDLDTNTNAKLHISALEMQKLIACKLYEPAPTRQNPGKLTLSGTFYRELKYDTDVPDVAKKVYSSFGLAKPLLLTKTDADDIDHNLLLDNFDELFVAVCRTKSHIKSALSNSLEITTASMKQLSEMKIMPYKLDFCNAVIYLRDALKIYISSYAHAAAGNRLLTNMLVDNRLGTMLAVLYLQLSKSLLTISCALGNAVEYIGTIKRIHNQHKSVNFLLNNLDILQQTGYDGFIYNTKYSLYYCFALDSIAMLEIIKSNKLIELPYPELKTTVIDTLYMLIDKAKMYRLVVPEVKNLMYVEKKKQQ